MQKLFFSKVASIPLQISDFNKNGTSLQAVSNEFVIFSSLWLILENTVRQYYRVGIKGSWFINHESIYWSQEPKICKTFIFHKLFFPKYDNFEITSTGNVCHLSIVKWVRLNNERTKCYKLCRCTLKFKIIAIFFSQNNIFCIKI